jgi:hypothetical protein
MSGISSQQYQLFVGSDVERIGKPQPAETSRVEWILLASVPRLITAGQVPDGVADPDQQRFSRTVTSE